MKIDKKIYNLRQLIEEAANQYGNYPAVKYLEKNKVIEKTYLELKQDVFSIASFLIRENMHNKNVAIIGSVSYEWIVSYYGIVSSGAVIVPVDNGLHEEDMIALLNQAGAEIIFFDKEIERQIPKISKGTLTIKKCIAMYSESKEMTVYDLIKQGGKDVCKIEPDNLATIVFTSGTTGKNKGVMLTHKNLCDDMMCSYYLIGKERYEAIVPVLPVHHMFEFTTGIQTPIYVGTPICIGRGVKYIAQSMQIYRPTILVLVPMIVEMLHKKVWMEARKQKKEKKLKVAIWICSILLKIGIDLRKKFFGDIINMFGGRLTKIVSGGAPLDERFVKEFKCFGIELLNGYGITECSPVISCNTTEKYRKNSVGCSIGEYTQVKVVDGEIWVRGNIVMKGYYRDEKATMEAFEGEWFKTGDLGYVDKDGFIFVTGRKKNLIILDNGENVSAEELEFRFGKIPHIKEILVYAKKSEQGKMIAAILVLDNSEQCEKSIEEVKKEVEKNFAEINKKLPYYKRVNCIEYQEEEFEKTTSGKIKRKNYIEE